TLTLSATMVVEARLVLDEVGAAVRDAQGVQCAERGGFRGVAGTPGLVPRSPAVVPEMAWPAFSRHGSEGFTLHARLWAVVPAVVPEMAWSACSRTGTLVLTLPARLWEVGQAAFGSADRDPNGPLGVVGVSRLAGEVAAADQPGFELREKTGTMLSMLASLNM